MFPIDLGGEPTIPLVVAGAIALAGFFFWRSKQATATPDASTSTSGGWLSDFVTGKAGIVTFLAMVFANRRELVDVSGKAFGLIWPIVVKIFGPNAGDDPVEDKKK